MKKVLLALAFVMGVGVAATQASPVVTAPSPGNPTPFCAVCGDSGVVCYANYGENCGIPPGMTQADHCSDQQAHDLCPGWAQLFPNRGLSNTSSSL